MGEKKQVPFQVFPRTEETATSVGGFLSVKEVHECFFLQGLEIIRAVKGVCLRFTGVEKQSCLPFCLLQLESLEHGLYFWARGAGGR